VGVTPTGVGLSGSYVFARLIAYDSNNNVIAYGKIRCLKDTGAELSPFGAAKKLAGSAPNSLGVWENSVLGRMNEDDFDVQMQGTMADNGGYAVTDTMQISVEGYGVSYVRFAVIGGECTLSPSAALSKVTIYASGGVAEKVLVNNAVLLPVGASAVQEAAGRIKTGSLITKQALLGGAASPAEVLLGLVKTFGLILSYDGQSKTITLLERGGFYSGSEVDISARIDRSKAYDVEPNGIGEKWLHFALGEPTGAFAERYKEKYDRPYGDKRVNTGSPFNADTCEVLEGVCFVEGVSGIDYGRYYYLVEDSSVGSDILPAPYLDNASKYTLWDSGTGEAEEFDVASLTGSATATTINRSDYPQPDGYDANFRLQLQGKDNDGANGGGGVLLWLDAWSGEYSHLTDDSAEMLNASSIQNDEALPCWIPYLSDTQKKSFPMF